MGEEDHLHRSYFTKLKNGDDRSQGGSEALNFASLFQDKEEGKLKLVVARLFAEKNLLPYCPWLASSPTTKAVARLFAE